MTDTVFAYGIGIGTQNSMGEWLEVYFPQPELSPPPSITDLLGNFDNNSELDHSDIDRLYKALEKAGEYEEASLVASLRGTDTPVVVVVLKQDSAPGNVPEAYLKLHLLSHRLVEPQKIVLDGLFGILPNVAWTSEGAIAIDDLPERQLAARLRGEVLEVASVDKFPKMANYVVPAGVRIAHTARVRLGAYLGEGTTVMHEGFINFNAGTEGPGMVEGRISAGVRIGAGSDLGGGCSTMGTLSGGGNVIISVGRDCLIGANAGIGIPLGDRCTVEAGLYVTAGTRINILDNEGKTANVVKARELAGKSDLLLRRNSISGAVECLTNQSAVELNSELHTHN
ncbi:MAG: 2,3,4,5-tetrahydropyridine-2,6-dicarboxylate N-succinyltransferase [Parahaliea sp.]